MISAKEIAAGLEKGRRVGDGYLACCPAHDDRNPSLSIKDGDSGKPVVYCFAGCSQESVIAALEGRGLWYTNPSEALSAGRRRDKRKAKPTPVKTLSAEDVAYIRRYWTGVEEWFHDGPKVQDHPYAIRKGITHACGALRAIVEYPFSAPTDCIVLPQRLPAERSIDELYLTGLQLISETGQKRNIGRHGYMFLGSWEHPRAVIHVVEGWATGWAVLEDWAQLTGYHGPSGCIVAFGEKHMNAAVEMAKSKYQRIPVIWNELENYDYLDLRTDRPDLAAMHMRQAMAGVLARV